MKVTGFVPQEGLALGVITTLAGPDATTFIVMVLDVAGLPVTHPVKSDVTTTLITSPLRGTVEYVAEFVPTGTPFLYHW